MLCKVMLRLLTIMSTLLIDSYENPTVDTTCSYLTNTKMYKQFPFMAAGKTSENFYLMKMFSGTRFYSIFEIGLENLNDHSVYISVKEHALPNKWPKLFESDEFKKVCDVATTSLVMKYNDDSYVGFADSSGSGVLYNIKAETATKYTFFKEKNFILISGEADGRYYSFSNSENKFKQYKYGGDDSDSDGLTSDQGKYLCVEASKVKSSNDKCKSTLKLTLMTGYVHDENFYLFDSDYVYSFKESIFDSSDSVDLNRYLYKSFLNCHGVAPLPKSGKEYVYIIGVVILVSSVILIIIFCSVKFRKQKKSKVSSTGKSSSKKHSSAKKKKKSAKSLKSASNKKSKQKSKSSKKSLSKHKNSKSLKKSSFKKKSKRSSLSSKKSKKKKSSKHKKSTSKKKKSNK